LAVDESKPIPIVCGPTASGKTGIAVELSDTFPIEIVSADSRQLLRHLEIGTAKPTAEERHAVPIHLIDLIEPGERYTAFRFIDDATEVIREVIARDRIPVVVGGTGLYLRALTEGVVEIDSEDMHVREELEQQMEQLGPERMHERLAQVDPLEATVIHPNNKIRVIRALEMFYLTGKSKSELVVTEAYKTTPFSFRYFCLMPPREELYQIINTRVDQMMEQGLLSEIQALIDRGMKDQISAANVIGYKELLEHLDNRLTEEEAVSLIKQNTRRYAKRQVTWFRKLDPGDVYGTRERLIDALAAYLATL
jgi:tRNA dimethylallyltransferase